MRGKLIVIEGTDCSGKETQSNLLLEHLNNDKIKTEKFSFPNYDSPTGKIIGGSYLGKPHIGACLFPEGAINVDPKVASLLYAADRKYNIDKINMLLLKGVNVILDRYVYSNMAHQGCKIESYNQRLEMYKWLEQLEFELLELPIPDISIFLHMPYEDACKLKKNRKELDEHELSESHLKKAEKTYVELSELYNWYTIECSNDGLIKSKDEIHKEVYEYVKVKVRH